MKLIKCSHCGRPFYNEEKACPYCGHAAHLSATNFVTRPISDPKSHHLMEEMLSGNYKPQPIPVHTAPIIQEKEEPVQATVPEQVSVPEPAPVEETNPEPVAVEEVEQPSEAVQERAENIAAVTSQNAPGEVENPDQLEDPNGAEIAHAPRKRHVWVWIIVIILILAIAAAVYLKWDFVYDKVKGLIG